MGFHNFIKVNMIGQLCISINDTDKTMKNNKRIFLYFLEFLDIFYLKPNIIFYMDICKPELTDQKNHLYLINGHHISSPCNYN